MCVYDNDVVLVFLRTNECHCIGFSTEYSLLCFCFDLYFCMAIYGIRITSVEIEHTHMMPFVCIDFSVEANSMEIQGASDSKWMKYKEYYHLFNVLCFCIVLMCRFVVNKI